MADSLRIREHELIAQRPFVIAGPCVLQSRELAFEIATAVKGILSERGVPFVFKASFDKANRSSIGSGRGVGMQPGLEWLAAIREELGLPVLEAAQE